jgi:hypothetical protein
VVVACDRALFAGRSGTLNKSTKRVRAATLVSKAALAFGHCHPVAVDGLRIANQAGQVGQRKAVAARCGTF